MFEICQADCQMKDRKWISEENLFRNVNFYFVHLREHSFCLLTRSSVKNFPATDATKDTRAVCSAEPGIRLNPLSLAENMLIEFQMLRCHGATSGVLGQICIFLRLLLNVSLWTGACRATGAAKH